jgi:hypothetical protein
MADGERDSDALTAQQRQEATEAQHRAYALRDDAERRMQSADEHQAATDERLERGIHRNDANG